MTGLEFIIYITLGVTFMAYVDQLDKNDRKEQTRIEKYERSKKKE